MNQPMSPPPPPPPSVGPPTGTPPTSTIVAQVQGPAIGLIVAAAFGALWDLLSLLSNLLGGGMAGLEELAGEYEGVSRIASATGGAVGVLACLISLGICGLIIWAALQMKELRNWTLAMVASILAMVPCIGACCLIGIPIGIWSLVVLMKPEVKAAFTA